MLFTKKKILFLLLLLFAADTGYTFFQHFHTALDGDLIPIVVPAAHYQEVLKDPFGFSVWQEGAVYAAPNRFFVHWFMVHYFQNVPQFLQYFLSPIDSLYAAAALVKTLTHLLLILSGALYLRLFFSGTRYEAPLLLGAFLLFPFFQYAYFSKVMGMVDLSVTYACFYALPFVLLLLFFYPFCHLYKTGKIPQTAHLGLVPLLFILPFSGPLITGLAPITCLVMFVAFYKKENSGLVRSLERVPWSVYIYFFVLGLLCCYSVYIGRNNIENATAELPLFERYLRLVPGIFKLLTTKVGLLLLLCSVLFNAYLLGKAGTPRAKNILKLQKYLALICLLYLLLLPLGGYREYRAYIVRYDTFSPVTFALICSFAVGAIYLLQEQIGKQKYFYRVFIIGLSVFYTLSDPPYFQDNFCERKALVSIAESKDEVTVLKDDCLVISWVKDGSLEATDIKSEFLLQIGISKELQLYYQE